MHIEFTEEQRMLRDSADKYLRDNYSFDKRQRIAKSGEGFDRERWQTFAELGWLAMTLPEEYGGLEGGALESMILCETLGHHLVLEPYLETIVLTAGLIASAGQVACKEKYLPGMAEGRIQGALATSEPGAQSNLFHVSTRAQECPEGYRIDGEKCVVFNGPAADVFVVSARTADEVHSPEGISLFAVDAQSVGVQRRDYPTYDGRHACELTLENVVVPAEALLGDAGQGGVILEQGVQQGLLALCAEAVGAMDALLQATIEYTKQRKQFGQPIADFQVLRHRMVDMFMEIELSRSLLLATAAKLDERSEDVQRMVSALKAHIGKSSRYVGQNAIQLHGGIGMTDELSVGHYFKRLTVIENLYGARDYHLGHYKDLQ